jgi:hypothetical protein
MGNNFVHPWFHPSKAEIIGLIGDGNENRQQTPNTLDSKTLFFRHRARTAARTGSHVR